MRFVVCGLLAALMTAAAGASANSQTQYYSVEFSGSGTYAVDYGDDRLQENIFTGAGVDGKEALTWSWRVTTLATRSGQNPIQHARAILQASFVGSGNVLSWRVQMAELPEDPMECKDQGSHGTWDGSQAPGPKGDRVTWRVPIHYGTKRADFGDRLPSSLAPETVACYHSPSEGLEDAWIPSSMRYPGSAFGRAIGASYSRTDRYAVDLRGDHGRVVDLNQLHTVRGRAQQTIRITRISEQTWRQRSKQFRRAPKFRTDFRP
jgi:hypothetical protein